MADPLSEMIKIAVREVLAEVIRTTDMRPQRLLTPEQAAEGKYPTTTRILEAPDRTGPPSDSEGLISLLEMLRFYAWFWVQTTHHLLTLRNELKSQEQFKWTRIFGSEVYWTTFTERWMSILQSVSEECANAQLAVSARHCAEVLRAAKEKHLKSDQVTSLVQTFERELSTHLFLLVPFARRDRYTDPTREWNQIIGQFPDCQEDVEEMQKCFALSRYTASVFHSLLVVEYGLIALGKYIGVTDSKAGWDATYRELDRLVKNRASVPPNLEFNFLEQTKARLDSMKLAWRNKVNHAAGRLVIEKTGFTDVSAEEVIVACRSFMRHLAEGLPK